MKINQTIKSSCNIILKDNLQAFLVIGLIIAIIQAVTSIQEQTLTFVPKLIVILVALVLLGSWMFASLRSYTISLFEMIPDMAR